MTEAKIKNPCLDCRHYYITWDQSFPYGCRAMGFNSKQSPCLDVMDASGLHCLRFELKPRLKQGGET